MSSNTQEPRNIVIIGGGIIGCCTAYYISRHPSFSPSTNVTILEASAHGVAQGASGKAGGLVSKKAYPEELVAVSFREHVKLAEEHNGKDKWGWRYVSCGSWTGRGENFENNSHISQEEGLKKSLGGRDASASTSELRTRAKGLPDDLNWVKKDLTDSYSAWTSDRDSAQVHPYHFTTSMLELAKDKGVRFLQGKATSIEKSDGRTTGVTYITTDNYKQNKTIPATDVILCAGAWSNTLPGISLPISAVRAHSITIRLPPSTIISPHVLFTEINLTSSCSRHTIVSPEIGECRQCHPGSRRM